MKTSKVPNTQSHLGQKELKKKKAEGITLYDFKTYYKSLLVRRALYWHKHRHNEQ
jgi:hypothetical protein